MDQNTPVNLLVCPCTSSVRIRAVTKLAVHLGHDLRSGSMSFQCPTNATSVDRSGQRFAKTGHPSRERWHPLQCVSWRSIQLHRRSSPYRQESCFRTYTGLAQTTRCMFPSKVAMPQTIPAMMQPPFGFRTRGRIGAYRAHRASPSHSDNVPIRAGHATKSWKPLLDGRHSAQYQGRLHSG